MNIVKSNPALKKLGMAKVRRRAKWNEDDAMVKQVFLFTWLRQNDM